MCQTDPGIQTSLVVSKTSVSFTPLDKKKAHCSWAFQGANLGRFNLQAELGLYCPEGT